VALEPFVLQGQRGGGAPPRCWLRHMALDHSTGLDRPNIKLRPAQGFESADYLIGGCARRQPWRAVRGERHGVSD
jgi:hypothetical protein